MRFRRFWITLGVVLLLQFGAPARAEGMIRPVEAKAVIVMDAATGRVLYSQNADTRLPIASTTKIMTALLALEQPDIYAGFEADERAIRVEGSSMGLQAGDNVTLYALAQGMLLASGNDGANAAAVRIAGSLPAFAERMNSRARELGMLDTNFVTPSGLDAEGHMSTAYDMALLTRHALRNPVFSEICGQYRMRASYGNPPYDRWLVNHNKLLNYYDAAIGVKTGFTEKAGRCLVSAAFQDGIALICVTLNCPDDWNAHEYLLEQCFPLQEIRELSEGIKLPAIPVTGGTQASVAITNYEDALFPVLLEGSRVEYMIRAPAFLYAPVKAGQSVGELQIEVDGQPLANLTLVSSADVPLLHPYGKEKGFLGRIIDFFSD